MVYEVTLAANGNSDPIPVTAGEWQLSLFADSFGSGPIEIQYASRLDEPERWQTIRDPYTDAPIARTAAGDPFAFRCGYGFFRLHASSIGTTTGLRLEVSRIGD